MSQLVKWNYINCVIINYIFVFLVTFFLIKGTQNICNQIWIVVLTDLTITDNIKINQNKKQRNFKTISSGQYSSKWANRECFLIVLIELNIALKRSKELFPFN